MKKLLFVLMAILIGITATACTGGGGNPSDDDGSDAVTGTVYVDYWKSGISIDFLEAMKEDFESTHEGITIDLSYSSEDANVFYNTIGQGADLNDIDLYIGTFYAFYGKTEYLEPLDSFLKEKADGETKTLGEKFVQVSYKQNGKTYALPWQGTVSGMVYNKKMFADNGWQLPKTTNQLIALADTIRTANVKSGTDTVTPFVHFANGYWKYMLSPWWAQYEGYSNYNNFWQAKYITDDGVEEQPSDQVWKQQGRLEALEVLEDLISPAGSVFEGSNTRSHTDMQTYFYNGKAAMMVNGAWLENEVGRDMDDFAMMEMPVISSLGTKLGITEDQLIAVIDYVDGTTATKPAGISDEIIERVDEARHMAWTEEGNFHVAMPKYSDVKGATKEFLKYFYSDRGQKLMASYVHTLPVVELDSGEVDTTEFSPFAKSCVEIQKDAVMLYKKMGYPLFHMTSLEEDWGVNCAAAITASNANDRKTAQELFNEMYAAIHGRWNQLVKQAGLD